MYVVRLLSFYFPQTNRKKKQILKNKTLPTLMMWLQLLVLDPAKRSSWSEYKQLYLKCNTKNVFIDCPIIHMCIKLNFPMV